MHAGIACRWSVIANNAAIVVFQTYDVQERDRLEVLIARYLAVHRGTYTVRLTPGILAGSTEATIRCRGGWCGFVIHGVPDLATLQRRVGWQLGRQAEVDEASPEPLACEAAARDQAHPSRTTPSTRTGAS
jgi:hypothetical protein